MNRLMETKRYRYCISLCFALGLLLVGSAARGQDAQANMEKQFAALQAGLGNIEKTGRITAAFDIDIAIDTYLEAAHAAFREATSAVAALFVFAAVGRG